MEQRSDSARADRLLPEHGQEKGLKHVAFSLARSPNNSAQNFLRQLSAKSPHREVQGAACLALAMSLGEEDSSTPQQQEESLALLERVVRDFGDLTLEDLSFKQIAEPMIFARKYLAVGSRGSGRSADAPFCS